MSRIIQSSHIELTIWWNQTVYGCVSMRKLGNVEVLLNKDKEAPVSKHKEDYG